ncbi:DEAD/DEAH box helicase [Desulfofalx alkaliphila]|uniref:DEAD/DEAH box helicase n=1 Tax=Desulfofalx alkaliphila TaxID=105483 RepID=UPI0004E11B13|nr:DEAD/DEAH box helicase [Desulfofalx alkaliphila]
MRIEKHKAYFGNLKINRRIYQSLVNMGFEEPTPIQVKAVPVIQSGKDVVGQAQTGTGKTAAFGIPIVDNLDIKKTKVQALVVTPTRELAIQVAEEISRIGQLLRVRTLPIYGGQSINRQVRSLQRGVQVVIGTPGRLLDHLRRGTLKLDNVKTVVLDEADEMLDMGFIDDITSLLDATPTDRQTLMFSATISEDIKRLAKRYMNQPESVAVSQQNITVPQIEQIYYESSEKDKMDVLCRLLDSLDIKQSIIFCRTKRGVDQLVAGLNARGFSAEGLHGDMTQYHRNSVMRKFKKLGLELLVATDVAARGLDIENVTHVINFDIPQDTEFYVHRIGRTGRAGRSGVAITIITPKDYRQLRTIERLTGTKIKRGKLPSAEDLAEIQREAVIKRMQQIIENGGLTFYRSIAESLAEEYTPMDVAAAALRLSLDLELGETAEEEGRPFGATGAKHGMVRLFITIGRQEKISPLELIKAISDESGIPGDLIGDIDIYEKFSFFEVPEDWGNCVLNCLDRQIIKGRRVIVQPAKGRNN